MSLRTPRAWYDRVQRPSVTRLALTPLSWIWSAVTARRIARAQPGRTGGAVICVGNLTLGGSGKTPVVEAVMDRLAANGVRGAVVARGHGGRERGPLRVNPERHLAADVGDEPRLLAARHRVWIARDRLAGARAAVAEGAQVVTLDDGHQNPSLQKDISLVVVDGETRDGEWPFGGGGVFPAGPLREPLAAGLARADAVVLLLPLGLEHPDPDLLRALAGPPVLVARLEADPPPRGPQFGFAGVGKPWKIARALEAAGCDLVDFAPYPDHAPYADADLARLAAAAAAKGAGLVTTEKDWARLPPAWRTRVTPWRVRARFDDPDRLDALIRALPGVS